jgi:putative membrane protein
MAMLLLRIILNGIAIVVAASFVPGLRLSGMGAALLAGVILGFVNGIIRPVLFLLTLPVTLLTLGLFIFVLNALCLALTAAIVPGFEIDSFLSAVLGACVVSLVSWILNGVLLSGRERK